MNNKQQYGRTAGIAAFVSRQTGAHVGMGLVVGPRHILTCAHVVSVSVGAEPWNQVWPTDDLEIRFPFGGRALRIGTVCEWHPPGETSEYDLALVETEKDVPTEVGTAILAEIAPRSGRPSHHVFGLPDAAPLNLQPEIKGKSVQVALVAAAAHNAIQVRPINESNAPLAAESTSTETIRPGYSGTGVWDDENQVLVGLVRSIDRGQAKPDAYFVPAAAIAQAHPSIGIEIRHNPSGLRFAWTAFAAVTVIVLSLTVYNSQTSHGFYHPRLAAYWGMHLYPAFAFGTALLWRRYAEQLRLHDWTFRVPRFAGLDGGPTLVGRRRFWMLNVVLFVLFPLCTQAHFIVKMHTRGHVYVYARDFHPRPAEFLATFTGPKLDKQDLVAWEGADLYSLAIPAEGAKGGFWGNYYQYGDKWIRNGVTMDVAHSKQFWPILQPVLVYLVTLAVLVMTVRALRFARSGV